MSRRRSAGFAPALAAVVVVFVAGFWPVLARRQTLLPVMPTVSPGLQGPRFVLDPMAPAWIVYPLGKLVHRLFERGEAPLWNPFSSCGEPLLAAVQGGVTSPWRWYLAAAEPAPLAWDLACLARLLFAGFGALWLGRVLGLRASAALTCAIGYMLSGFLVLNVNLDSLDGEVVLPYLAASVILFMRRPGTGRWTGCVAAASPLLLAGNPQVALVAGAFAAGLGCFLARPVSGPVPRNRLAALALAGAVSAGCAAVILLPLADFLPRAQHVHAGAGARGEPLWGIVSLFAPRLLGGFGEPVDGVNPFHFLPYAGAAVAVLAAAGFARAWRRPEGPAFCLAPVVLLAAAYGIPPVSWIGRLPGLEWLWWAKYQGPTYLSLAVLAGYGVETLASSRTAWGPAAAAAVAVELLWLMPTDRPEVHEPLREAAHVKILRAAMDPHEDRLYASGDWLHPQAGAALGLRDVRSYYGVMPRRTYWYMRGLVTGPARNSNEAVMTGSPRASPALGAPALRAMAVRWIVTDEGTPRGALPPSAERIAPGSPAVYRLADSLARARVVGRAVRVDGAREALYETSAAPADPVVAFVEGPPDWPGFRCHAEPGPARIERESANEVECRVPGAGPRVLLLADSWEPGWKAFAAGRRLRVLPANAMFRAVALPARAKTVRFLYDPLPFKLGLLLSSWCAFGCAGLFAARPRRRLKAASRG